MISTGKRRHFIISVAGTAAFLLLLCGLWPRGVAIEESEAHAVLKVWLAADYRQLGEDPALRGPSTNALLTATASDTAPIAFKHFEVRRPFIKPSGIKHAALVRAEIIYDGMVPSENEAKRCFLLVQPVNQAWQVRREIGESAYRWRLGF